MPGPLKSNFPSTETRLEWLEKSSPQDAGMARRALEANKGKNFVQRITNASDWPVVQNPGGSYSSHRMANTDNYVYPTLFYSKDTNALYEPEDPMAEAKRTGEFIEMGSPEEAAKFAEGAYKVGMDTGLMQKILRPEVVNQMWRR